MKLAKCPYCSKPVSYPAAFLMRNNGEFFCNKCKKESNVLIRKMIVVPFIAAVIVALIITGAFFIMTDRDNPLFMLYVAVPFIAFYLLTPLFVVLRPKKKHMDVLYDTHMVDSQSADPDPTMAKSSKVVPAFVDDVVLTKDDRPIINSDVFNAIKEERRVGSQVENGDTKSFSRFENISSSKVSDKTKPVGSFKDIDNSPKTQQDDDNHSDDYDISLFS